MAGMTPERLADIEARHATGLGRERPGDVAALLREVKRLQHAWSMAEPMLTERDALAAEVRRLRAGIERCIEHPTWHRGMYGSPFDMVRTDNLHALLNPTEQAGGAS